MVETAEQSANMTVKYLPTFARVYPAAMISEYTKYASQVNSSYISNVCNFLCFAAH